MLWTFILVDDNGWVILSQFGFSSTILFSCMHHLCWCKHREGIRKEQQQKNENLRRERQHRDGKKKWKENRSFVYLKGHQLLRCIEFVSTWPQSSKPWWKMSFITFLHTTEIFFGSVFVHMIVNDNERRNEHKSNEFVPNIGDSSSYCCSAAMYWKRSNSPSCTS